MSLGFEGICKDLNTVRYCGGTLDTDIQDEVCDSGAECQDDGFAHCVATNNPCDTLGAVGTCEGNVLKYCTSGMLTVKDCSKQANVQFCEEDTCEAGLFACCD